MYRIRPATSSDAVFLADMLVEASNWHPDRKRVKADLLADGRVTRFLRGWMRPADGGVVALDVHGAAIGAAWFRVLPKFDAGTGFVASGVPELILGVKPMYRAQGVGRALVQAACDLAGRTGHQRMSLSVERANFAQRLYRSEGFVTLDSDRTSDTMTKTLR